MRAGAFMGIADPYWRLRTRMRRARWKRQALRQAASCTDVASLKVHGPVWLSPQTHLGRNVNFNGLRVNGHGTLHIGDNFHSGEDCLIITQNHRYHGEALPYDDTYDLLPVHIGDNVWFGSRVTVLGGVTIGEGAIVQAASCVVRDVPPGAIVGGHPAQVFSQRDMEHYERLKAEGRFH
jgi:acetyltransferase-like isoleucine patch superfamily enzyme